MGRFRHIPDDECLLPSIEEGQIIMPQIPSFNVPTFDGEEILAGIRRWVEIETPSHDDAAVNRLVDVVESDLTRIGARTMRTPGRDGYGDVLEAHAPWNRNKEP